MKTFCKISFLIRGLEVSEIFPFPVRIIPFPVLKINFETFGSKEKHFVLGLAGTGAELGKINSKPLNVELGPT